MPEKESESQVIILHGLRPEEYEHSLDRQALNALEGTPGLEKLIQKLSEFGIEVLFKLTYTGSNIKVTPQMFPELHKELLSVCQTLNLKKIPDLYIKDGGEINAFAIGSENPIIVLNGSAIMKLNPKELTFILGHEVGHIKSQHMVYKMLADAIVYLGYSIGKVTLGIGEIFTSPIKFALLAWSRKSEFTCDRAGLLACQDVNSAMTAFMKMAGAPQLYYDSLDTTIFIEQARIFEGFDEKNLDKFMKLYMNLERTHPWTVLRCAELQKWIDSGSYQELLTKHSKQVLQKEVLCENCNNRVKDGVKFCIFCGYEFKCEHGEDKGSSQYFNENRR